jgi:hypothetical protein
MIRKSSDESFDFDPHLIIMNTILSKQNIERRKKITIDLDLL